MSSSEEMEYLSPARVFGQTNTTVARYKRSSRLDTLRGDRPYYHVALLSSNTDLRMDAMRHLRCTCLHTSKPQELSLVSSPFPRYLPLFQTKARRPTLPPSHPGQSVRPKIQESPPRIRTIEELWQVETPETDTVVMQTCIV